MGIIDIASPFLKLATVSFFVALIFQSLRKTRMLYALFVIPFVLYFGFQTSLLVTVIVAGCVSLRSILLKKLDIVIGSVVSFFICVQLYTVIGIFVSPAVGFYSVIVVLILLSFYALFANASTIKLPDFRSSIMNISFLEWWVVVLAFIMSSHPQWHWDAVHANLYNAKWYVLNNSFNPLPESISSLFPQSAVAYYSFFYHIGSLRALQIAYIVPLLITLFILHKFTDKLKLKFFELLIFLPIFIFQASNGYYDLLMLSLVFSGIYLCVFDTDSIVVKLYCSSFLFGYAGGAKYFPLIYGLLPVLIALKNKVSIKHIGALIILLVLPLILWSYRTYQYTGSPVFPFMQRLFPTPLLWDKNQIIENLPMIQTPITTIKWIVGGVLLYPLFTYVHSISYIEATNGYTGIVYVLLIPIQLIVYIILIRKLLKRQFHEPEFILFYTFLAYFLIGLVARYYRYVWPFQFIHVFFVLRYALIFLSSRGIALRSFFHIFLTVCFLVFFSINLIDSNRYFRYFPYEKRLFLSPDYYEQSKRTDHSILSINSQKKVKHEALIFDASSNKNGRVHFNFRTFQCNWYYMGIEKQFVRTKNSVKNALKFLRPYTFLILDKNSTVDTASCPIFTALVKEKTNYTNAYTQIYSDSLYTVYEKK